MNQNEVLAAVVEAVSEYNEQLEEAQKLELSPERACWGNPPNSIRSVWSI